jgi:translation initiation factor 3 subunit H
LKIAKHSQENMPELISGFLVGIDEEDTLYISNAFPIPNGMSGEDSHNYQLNVLKHCESVNFDAYNVGWYQSTYLGSYINETLIRNQYTYQTNPKTTNKCVALIYDQMKTVRTGSLSIKALRLTDQFIKSYSINKGE